MLRGSKTLISMTGSFLIRLDVGSLVFSER
jgi:hypothetical protein